MAAPAQRADVLRVHEAWKQAFRRPGAKFVNPFDEDAITIAKAVDLYGESDCLLVLKYAPEDEKVTGRTDEKREKHESIRYIFGNNDAFTRILSLAHKRESAKTTGSPSAIIAKLKAAEPVRSRNDDGSKIVPGAPDDPGLHSETRLRNGAPSASAGHS